MNSTLVCLTDLCSSSTLGEVGVDGCGLEGVEEPPPPKRCKVTLVDLCSLLQIRISTQKSKVKAFPAPLCPECGGDVARIQDLVSQIGELEESIRGVRALIQRKVLGCDGEGEKGFQIEVEEGEPEPGVYEDEDEKQRRREWKALSSQLVKGINNIRRDITQADIRTAAACFKKPGRKPGSKNKEHRRVKQKRKGANVAKVADAEHPPQSPNVTPSGREKDEGEQKFDPNSSHDSQEKKVKVDVPVKTEVAGIGADEVDPSSVQEEFNDKTEAADDTYGGSEMEFEAGLSDAGGSDCDDDVLEENVAEMKIQIPHQHSHRYPTRRKQKQEKMTQLEKDNSNLPLVGASTTVENFDGGVVENCQVKIDNEKPAVQSPKTVAKTKKGKKTESIHKCEICPTIFSNKAGLKQHMNNIHGRGEGSYPCRSCNKVFRKFKDVIRHRKTEHRLHQRRIGEDGVSRFECEICQASFKDSRDLIIHRRRHTGERPFTCSLCSRAFIAEGRREVHIEVAHPGVAPLKCKLCPRSFFRYHRLRLHKKSHLGERPYLCEVCSKAFSTAEYLKCHQAMHKGLNVEGVLCNECDKKFCSSAALQIHKETQHQGRYRYYCDECGHGTSFLSHMRIHKRTHTGERPFACPHCDKCFARGSALKVHIRSHTGERPYVCDICETAFIDSGKLKRHKLACHATEQSRSVDINEAPSPTTPREDEPFPDISIGQALAMPEELGNVQLIEISENANSQSVPTVEHVEPSAEAPVSQRQLVTVELPGGMTYQVITNASGNIEPFAEYIILDGEFTTT